MVKIEKLNPSNMMDRRSSKVIKNTERMKEMA